jgi:hypothetical protein
MPRLSGGNCVTSRPETCIEPAKGLAKPAIVRSNVVLPQPGAKKGDEFTFFNPEVKIVENRCRPLADAPLLYLEESLQTHVLPLIAQLRNFFFVLSVYNSGVTSEKFSTAFE